MIRIFLATLAGTVVIYLWLLASWMFLGLHNSSFLSLPEPDNITKALQEKDLKTGAYHAPAFPDVTSDASEEEKTAAMAEFTKQHNEGPIYTVFYHEAGKPVMGMSTIGRAILLDLICAAIAACMLWAATPRLWLYPIRAAFVAMLGLFVALMGHGSYWVWMHFPLDYTIAMCLDQVIGWSLVGLVQAAIIRPPSKNKK